MIPGDYSSAADNVFSWEDSSWESREIAERLNAILVQFQFQTLYLLSDLLKHK